MTQALQTAYDQAIAVFSQSFRFAEWKFVDVSLKPPEVLGDRGWTAREVVLKFDRPRAKGEGDKWIYVCRDAGDVSTVKEEIRIDKNGVMYATETSKLQLAADKRGSGKNIGKYLSLPRRVTGDPNVYRFYASRVRLSSDQIKDLEKKIQNFAPRTLLEPEKNDSVVTGDPLGLLVPAVDPITIALHLQQAYADAADEVIDYTVPHGGLDEVKREQVKIRRKKQLLTLLMNSLLGEPQKKIRQDLAQQLDDHMKPSAFLTHYDAEVARRVRNRDRLGTALVRWLESDAMKIARDAHRAAGTPEWEAFLFAWCRAHARVADTQKGIQYLSKILDDKQHFAHEYVWPAQALSGDQLQAVRKGGMTLVETWESLAKARALTGKAATAASDAATTLAHLTGVGVDVVPGKATAVAGLAQPLTSEKLKLKGNKALDGIDAGKLGAFIEAVNFVLSLRSASTALASADPETKTLALVGLLGSALDAASALDKLLGSGRKIVGTLSLVSGVIDIYLGVKSSALATSQGDPDAATAANIQTLGAGVTTTGALMGLVAFPGGAVIGILGLATVALGYLFGALSRKSPLEFLFLHSTWGKGDPRGVSGKPDWSPTTYLQWKDKKDGLDHQLEALLTLLCLPEVSRPGQTPREFKIKSAWLPPEAKLNLTYVETWERSGKPLEAVIKGTITFGRKQGPVSSTPGFVVKANGTYGVDIVVPPPSGMPKDILERGQLGVLGAAKGLKGVKLETSLVLAFEHAPTLTLPRVPQVTVLSFGHQFTSGLVPGFELEPAHEHDESRLGLLGRESPFASAAEAPFVTAELELGPGESEATEDIVATEAESGYDPVPERPRLPSRAELRATLAKASFGPKASSARRDLDAALQALGSKEFEAALRRGLSSAPWLSEPGTSAIQPILARLGAEAFVRGIALRDSNQELVGVISDLDRLAESPSLTQRKLFVYFASERLRQLSGETAKPAEHRRQMVLAERLFRFVQAEPARKLRLLSSTQPELDGYRRLLAAVIWRYYQALLDHTLHAGTDPAARAGLLAELESDCKLAAVTDIADDAAYLPTFRLEGRAFRDYFAPAAATDLRFDFFGPAPKARAEQAFKTSFVGVLMRRREQHVFLRELSRRSGAKAWPEIHDDASWQAWLRASWRDEPGSVRQKLERVLTTIGDYFRLFTVHAPHDVREGCRERSYLTRRFPRAVNGATVHDCAVYALRWLHLLGGLLDAQHPAEGVQEPRAFLVEMPVHLGVMIRLNPEAGKELLISINNRDAEVLGLVDTSASDQDLAKRVVQEMYPNPPTPFHVRPVTASLSDAHALWKQACRAIEAKLDLPYPGPDRSYLRYLKYKAASAKVYATLREKALVAWATLQRGLANKASKTSTASKISTYAAEVKKAALEAVREHEVDVLPLAQEIATELEKHRARLPRGAAVAAGTTLSAPWMAPATEYQRKLSDAEHTGKLVGLNPSEIFPPDDFVAQAD